MPPPPAKAAAPATPPVSFAAMVKPQGSSVAGTAAAPQPTPQPSPPAVNAWAKKVASQAPMAAAVVAADSPALPSLGESERKKSAVPSDTKDKDCRKKDGDVTTTTASEEEKPPTAAVSSSTATTTAEPSSSSSSSAAKGFSKLQQLIRRRKDACFNQINPCYVVMPGTATDDGDTDEKQKDVADGNNHDAEGGDNDNTTEHFAAISITNLGGATAVFRNTAPFVSAMSPINDLLKQRNIRVIVTALSNTRSEDMGGAAACASAAVAAAGGGGGGGGHSGSPSNSLDNSFSSSVGNCYGDRGANSSSYCYAGAAGSSSSLNASANTSAVTSPNQRHPSLGGYPANGNFHPHQHHHQNPSPSAGATATPPLAPFDLGYNGSTDGEWESYQNRQHNSNNHRQQPFYPGGGVGGGAMFHAPQIPGGSFRSYGYSHYGSGAAPKTSSPVSSVPPTPAPSMLSSPPLYALPSLPATPVVSAIGATTKSGGNAVAVAPNSTFVTPKVLPAPPPLPAAAPLPSASGGALGGSTPALTASAAPAVGDSPPNAATTTTTLSQVTPYVPSAWGKPLLCSASTTPAIAPKNPPLMASLASTSANNNANHSVTATPSRAPMTVSWATKAAAGPSPALSSIKHQPSLGSGNKNGSATSHHLLHSDGHVDAIPDAPLPASNVAAAPNCSSSSAATAPFAKTPSSRAVATPQLAPASGGASGGSSRSIDGSGLRGSGSAGNLLALSEPPHANANATCNRSSSPPTAPIHSPSAIIDNFYAIDDGKSDDGEDTHADGDGKGKEKKVPCPPPAEVIAALAARCPSIRVFLPTCPDYAKADDGGGVAQTATPDGALRIRLRPYPVYLGVQIPPAAAAGSDGTATDDDNNSNKDGDDQQMPAGLRPEEQAELQRHTRRIHRHEAKLAKALEAAARHLATTPPHPPASSTGGVGTKTTAATETAIVVSPLPSSKPATFASAIANAWARPILPAAVTSPPVVAVNTPAAAAPPQQQPPTHSASAAPSSLVVDVPFYYLHVPVEDNQNTRLGDFLGKLVLLMGVFTTPATAAATVVNSASPSPAPASSTSAEQKGGDVDVEEEAEEGQQDRTAAQLRAAVVAAQRTLFANQTVLRQIMRCGGDAEGGKKKSTKKEEEEETKEGGSIVDGSSSASSVTFTIPSSAALSSASSAAPLALCAPTPASVLVHCLQGVSRSASIVMAFVMANGGGNSEGGEKDGEITPTEETAAAASSGKKRGGKGKSKPIVVAWGSIAAPTPSPAAPPQTAKRATPPRPRFVVSFSKPKPSAAAPRRTTGPSTSSSPSPAASVGGAATRHVPYSVALDSLTIARPVVNPNPFFRAQLVRMTGKLPAW